MNEFCIYNAINDDIICYQYLEWKIYLILNILFLIYLKSWFSSTIKFKCWRVRTDSQCAPLDPGQPRQTLNSSCSLRHSRCDKRGPGQLRWPGWWWHEGRQGWGDPRLVNKEMWRQVKGDYLDLDPLSGRPNVVYLWSLFTSLNFSGGSISTDGHKSNLFCCGSECGARQFAI